MTPHTVQVYCLNTGTKKSFPAGLTLAEMLPEFSFDRPYPIVSARVNNRSEGLGFRVYNNKDVEFLDMRAHSGLRTYIRTLCMVLCKAVRDLYPDGKILLEHPVSKGYYCTLELGRPAQLEDAAAIKNRMKELIAAALPIHRVESRSEEAMEMYRKQGMDDKEILLKTTGYLYTTYYILDGYADYFYGPLLRNTSELYLFDFVKYYDGFLLRIPQAGNPNELGEIIKQEKMLETFREYLDWQKIVGLSNVGDLNQLCQSGRGTDLIHVGEALQEKCIIRIADEITARVKGEHPLRLVLISGPSSSGKTTFSKRLSVQLMADGILPYPVSLDDYFVPREQTPLDEHGEYDYESLYALDLDLFNQHMAALSRGEEIELPTYNFVSGMREYTGKKLRLTDDMVLILEGIHALNPELTAQIPDGEKYRIYVSALTTMSLDDHNWIPTTDTRLVRRIIRDYNYRGCSALDTIKRWPGVRAGEDKWIFPYQENADAMFNSALLFEFSILRHYAEPILMSVPQNTPQYAEAVRLLHFLRYFTSIQDADIPRTSLMREFVGGSSFQY